jgi:hypothetical protein
MPASRSGTKSWFIDAYTRRDGSPTGRMVPGEKDRMIKTGMRLRHRTSAEIPQAIFARTS